LNPQARYSRAPHIELMAAALEDCRRGRIKRLIINVPPRHLKSLCASVAFPAYVLGHNPAANIICASNGQDLADKLARDCRRIMNTAWYQTLFPTRLADRQAVYDFATTERGTRMATSVGGVLTGRGADLIIIDDPLKPDEALSETRRKAVNEWYDGTLLSRLNNKGTDAIVLVMQRLHQDDLVGHVLEQNHWTVASVPAIAEEEEAHRIKTLWGWRTFRRSRGDVLDPTRETAETLAQIRATIGEYHFSAQYQQNPTPLGGAIIKTDWLKRYDPSDLPETFTLILQSWDTANKATELNDYSVCTTWGIVEGRFFLLDVYRERLNYPDLRRRVKQLATQYVAHTVLIEDKASGTQLIQDLKEQGMASVIGYTPPPNTDKMLRLHAQTPAFENGAVLLPNEATWLATYVNELISFPGSRHDDQIDSTAQALDYLHNSWSLEKLSRYLENAPAFYARLLRGY
jgi:predicted phage terminase large subunit-like protein